MVSLSQKLKMPKTCEKPFYKIIRVVLCKKTTRKNNKYWRYETILKMGHLAKGIAHAKSIYSLWKMVSLGQKFKMPKICEKPFYQIIRVFLCKKPLEKTTNIGEMRQFRKSAILQRL